VRSLAKLPQDFTDLLIELCEAKAEFLLIGGWAVILYGHVRATDDMDIFVRPSTENSERVFAALDAFGELDGYRVPYIGKAALIETRKRLDAIRTSRSWKSSSA